MSGSTWAAGHILYTGILTNQYQNGYIDRWADFVTATASNVNQTVLGPSGNAFSTAVITCRCQGHITSAGSGTTVGAGFYIESRAYYTKISGTLSSLGSMTIANLTDSGVFDTVNSFCIATQSGTTLGCSINPVTNSGTLGTMAATIYVEATYN